MEDGLRNLNSFYTYNIDLPLTCHFLRLTMVRIFSRAAVQAKEAALKETLVCQTLLQGKRKPALQPRAL